MRAWMFAAGLATLAGLSQAGMWAYSELTAPVQAESVAVAEARARGIEWPIIDRAESYGSTHFYFWFGNPSNNRERVEITVERGTGLARISNQRDEQKWPVKQSAVSR